jgi:hypothetical protein
MLRDKITKIIDDALDRKAFQPTVVVDQLESLFNSNLKEEREIVKLCAKEQSCSMCKEYLGRKK